MASTWKKVKVNSRKSGPREIGENCLEKFEQALDQAPG